MQKVRAKKSLGQHFLTDMNITAKIADALQAPDNNLVVEIGPGMGVLTDFLLNKYPNFKAIEIDRESIAYLKKKYTENSFIVEGDFLKMDLRQFKEPFAIIGNFPYYISSQIFFRVLENRQQVTEVVCMIQKEVAERIAAPHGSKTYGILSVLLQAYYNIEYLFTVDEHAFNPPPKVKSGVIRLIRNEQISIDCNEKLFFSIVKQSFNQRRKTLRNSLKNICLNLPIEKEIFSKRPEQLDVSGFVELTKIIENCLSKQG